MSWFHGKINREDAERRLRYQGDYLVRSHGNGQFVLSCMDSGSVRHLLLVDPHGQVRFKQDLLFITCQPVEEITKCIYFWEFRLFDAVQYLNMNYDSVFMLFTDKRHCLVWLCTEFDGLIRLQPSGLTVSNLTHPFTAYYKKARNSRFCLCCVWNARRRTKI